MASYFVIMVPLSEFVTASFQNNLKDNHRIMIMFFRNSKNYTPNSCNFIALLPKRKKVEVFLSV